MKSERLQKYIASCGVTSRRKAEILIEQGRVKVNGKTISHQGHKVSEDDCVTVDGKLINPEENKIYILLNKPEGVISSVSDEVGRKTVLDFIEGITERVYPVGRLDYDSSGLLIITNDGSFTKYMTHPSHEVDKTYVAFTNRDISDAEIKLLSEGVNIGDYITSPARISRYSIERKDVLRISIHEGRNRQVRRMLEIMGAKVKRLERVGIGNIFDSSLKPGKWRFITKKELRNLGYVVD